MHGALILLYQFIIRTVQVPWDTEHENDVCDECEMDRMSSTDPSDWWSCKECSFQCCRDCADSGCLDDGTGLCLRCQDKMGEKAAVSRGIKKKK